MSSAPTPYPSAPGDDQQQQNECLYVMCSANSLKTDDGSFLTKCCPCFGSGSSSPQVYLEFSRILGDGSPQMVHRTELVKNNTDHQQWHSFELKLEQLCEGDKSRPFLIECFQEHRPNPKLLGFACTTVVQLQSMDEQKRVVHLLDEHGHQSKSQIHFSEFQMRQQLLNDEASIGTETKVLAEVPVEISSTKTREIAPYRPDVHVPMPITSSTSTNNSIKTVSLRGEDGGHGGSVSVQQHGVSVHGGGISVRGGDGHGGGVSVQQHGVSVPMPITSSTSTTNINYGLNNIVSSVQQQQQGGGVSVQQHVGVSQSQTMSIHGSISVQQNGANVSIKQHGVSVDGVSVDGVSVDGVSVDGVSVDGVSVDGVSVDGLSIIQQNIGGQSRVIVNGILYENGTSRALTVEEREKLEKLNRPKVEQHAGGISVRGRHGQSLSVYGGHGGKVSVHGGHGGNVSVHEGHGGNMSVHGGHGGNVTIHGGNVSSVRGGHGGNVTVHGGNVSSVHGGHGGNVSVKQHGVSSVQQHGGGVGHNCVIVNGILYENGTSRALTAEEREKLRHHNQAWQHWSKEFNKAGNCSSSTPEKPQFPCFCSSAWAQSSSQNSNNN